MVNSILDSKFKVKGQKKPLSHRAVVIPCRFDKRRCKLLVREHTGSA